MRTRKQDLVSDELKPIVSKILKEYRLKYNYSFEDLSKALNHKKNRQTLHKYESGILNIPYELFFEICKVFNIESDVLKDIPLTEEETEIFNKKMIKEFVHGSRSDRYLTPQVEKMINTYKNASYDSQVYSNISIKVLDDSMAPNYLKNDKIYFKKQESYKNGDDIIIAIKNDTLAVRRLYKYPKGIILQAINPKYPTINVNIVSNDMILGKVTAITREIK